MLNSDCSNRDFGISGMKAINWFPIGATLRPDDSFRDGSARQRLIARYLDDSFRLRDFVAKATADLGAKAA